MQAIIKKENYRRGVAAVTAVTAVVVGFLVIFGAQAIQRIQAVENHWAVYSQDANEADQLLHNISVPMGYGGFIHNFKNYILRRDPQVLKVLIKNRAAVDADLRALQKRVINAEEKAALKSIHAVLTKYDNAIDRAGIAFSRGLSDRKSVV